jgi:hypothetical protein
MDKLFPIIRRKRRPLVVQDVPPIPTKIEPVQSVAAVPLVEPAEISKSDDAAIPPTTETP